MAKKKVARRVIEKTGTTLAAVWGFVAWLTGVIVSLAVGFGLVTGTLFLPKIPLVVTMTAGWIVVVLTALGAVLALIDKALN
jgi:hypothetical protein